MVLNGGHIEMCDDFVYLGILFHYNWNFLHNQKSLSNQGRKALFNLYSKFHDDCFNHVNHETLLSLFDTYVSCILNCGCEVWGPHRGEDIEKVHLNFLKRTLKVRRSTVNFMIYFELERVSMYVERYCKMIKYWCKILKTENIVLKTCYETMFESSQRKFNQKYNWVGKIRDILCKYGFNDIWISQNVCNVDKFLHEFKQRVIDCFVREAVSFFEDSPRCHYHRYIHDNHKLQFYLSRPINYMFKPLICKYRIHAHNLKIESGQYFNIDRHERICD